MKFILSGSICRQEHRKSPPLNSPSKNIYFIGKTVNKIDVVLWSCEIYIIHEYIYMITWNIYTICVCVTYKIYTHTQYTHMIYTYMYDIYLYNTFYLHICAAYTYMYDIYTYIIYTCICAYILYSRRKTKTKVDKEKRISLWWMMWRKQDREMQTR